MPPIDSITKEQLTRALGQAVIRIWSNLPQHVQDHLFKEAVASKGESIRSELAVFLHDKHSRTADPLGNPREAKEPDSLGLRISARAAEARLGNKPNRMRNDHTQD